MGDYFGEGSPGTPVDTGSGSASTVVGADPWLDFSDGANVLQSPGSKIAVLPVSLAGAGSLVGAVISALTIGVYKTVDSEIAFTADTHAYLIDTRDDSILADQLNTGFGGDAIVDLTDPGPAVVDALVADALAIGVAFDATGPDDPDAVATWKQTWYAVLWGAAPTPGPWLDADPAETTTLPLNIVVGEGFDLLLSTNDAETPATSYWPDVYAGGAFVGQPATIGGVVAHVPGDFADGPTDPAHCEAVMNRYRVGWLYPPVLPSEAFWPEGAVGVEAESPAGVPLDDFWDVNLHGTTRSSSVGAASEMSLLRVPEASRSASWYDPAALGALDVVGKLAAPTPPVAAETTRTSDIITIESGVDSDDTVTLLTVMTCQVDNSPVPGGTLRANGLTWAVTRTYQPPRYRFLFEGAPAPDIRAAIFPARLRWF